MRIGGIQKFSLLDYPGKVSAIVFTQGCNFRCPYCHNPELVLPESYRPSLQEEEVLSFLQKRAGKLSAVSITGGEPTLQGDLGSFIGKAKELGYAVKLDTNGSRPHVIKDLLLKGMLDFIAMDIKAPLARYSEIAKANVNTDDILLSVRLIVESGLEHEFRTTFSDSYLKLEDLQQILETIRGARSYVLQRFVPSKTVDESICVNAPSESDLSRIRSEIVTDIPLRLR